MILLDVTLQIGHGDSKEVRVSLLFKFLDAAADVLQRRFYDVDKKDVRRVIAAREYLTFKYYVKSGRAWAWFE